MYNNATATHDNINDTNSTIYIHIHVCVCPPGSPLRTSPSFVDPVESPSRFDYLHDYCCVIHIIYTHVCMYVCVYIYIYI